MAEQAGKLATEALAAWEGVVHGTSPVGTLDLIAAQVSVSRALSAAAMAAGELLPQPADDDPYHYAPEATALEAFADEPRQAAPVFLHVSRQMQEDALSGSLDALDLPCPTCGVESGWPCSRRPPQPTTAYDRPIR